MPGEQAQVKAAMLIVASLAYGYADHALAVLEVAASLLGAERVNALARAVRSTGRGLRPLRDGNAAAFQLLDALARAFKPSHGGWASVGQPLGSRRRGPFWT
jgi:hypothetical protein